ncbi:MAG TPA: hypothetical protein VE222_06615 [Nitrospiraceae bacterium]|nr:hypothetical protein [Nitrospiraceae bacterium]
MTLIEVFDRLCCQRVNRIDFKDGSSLVCPHPALVDYHDTENALADMWIEPSEDGLLLHFNGRDFGRSLYGETQPLNNIASVS